MNLEVRKSFQRLACIPRLISQANMIDHASDFNDSLTPNRWMAITITIFYASTHQAFLGLNLSDCSINLQCWQTQNPQALYDCLQAIKLCLSNKKTDWNHRNHWIFNKGKGYSGFLFFQIFFFSSFLIFFIVCNFFNQLVTVKHALTETWNIKIMWPLTEKNDLIVQSSS